MTTRVGRRPSGRSLRSGSGSLNASRDGCVAEDGSEYCITAFPEKSRCKWNSCRPSTARKRATRLPSATSLDHRNSRSLVVVHRGMSGPVRGASPFGRSETPQRDHGRAAFHGYSGHGGRAVGAVSRASLTGILRNAAAWRSDRSLVLCLPAPRLSLLPATRCRGQRQCRCPSRRRCRRGQFWPCRWETWRGRLRRSNSAVRLGSPAGWKELHRCRPRFLPHCLAEPRMTPNRADRLRPFLCCLFRCQRAPCRRPGRAEAVRRRRNRGAWLTCRNLSSAPAPNCDQNLKSRRCWLEVVRPAVKALPRHFLPAIPLLQTRRAAEAQASCANRPLAELPQLSRSRLTCDGGGAMTAGAGSVSLAVDAMSRGGC
jgi:hypothetical protein